MSARLPTYVRRDEYTGPAALRGMRVANLLGDRVCDLFGRAFAKLTLVKKRVTPMLAAERPVTAVGGSRQHYFHFLLGYLLPLVHMQNQRRFDTFLALDCGPLMTPILRETLSRLGHNFRIVSPRDVEHPVFLEAWDFGWEEWDAGGAVRHAVDLVRQAWSSHACPGHDCPRSAHLLIQRSAPHRFYVDGGSELGGYGTGRRELTNIQEVSEFLTRNGVVHAVYEPGAHSLGCQIEAFSASRRLLGFRGAEWANLMWAPAESRARILDNDPPAVLLERLLTERGIRHEFAIVPGPRFPENPHEALRFFTEE